MVKCNYRGPRARYIPSDCKYCNPGNCQEYQGYLQALTHEDPGQAHKWYFDHKMKQCPTCGQSFQARQQGDPSAKNPPGDDKLDSE